MNLQKCGVGFLLGIFCCLSYAKCTTQIAHNIIDKWQQAYNAGDVTAISDFYAKDAILIGVYNQRPLVTSKQRLNYFKNIFGKKSYKVRFVKNTFHHYKLDNSVVINGEDIISYRKAGKKIQRPVRFTMVFKDTLKGCKLVVQHASLISPIK
ncbi:MAG: nuclear transport factor 2 family protein [Tatlockia sp.]|nr:nuclear transport factor 2 family protein [Tatlockia sp.]